MTTRPLGTVLMFAMAALAHSVSAEDRFDTQMIISIKVCEKVAEDGKPQVLAETTIAATPGRPFSFESGGTVKPAAGGGDLEIGTQVTGDVKCTRTGPVQLSLKIRMGVAVSQDDDPQTDLVRTEALDIRTILLPGETKRLKSSASQWCEICVDAVN